MPKASKHLATQRSIQAANPQGVQEIRFYRSNEKPYGVFSNLYRRSILYDGRIYETAEHAYQAGKPAKESVREWILSAPSPALVAMAAHGLYTWDIVPNWSRIKLDRMRGVLRAKFSQHEDLREILLSTGDAKLIESARVDNAVNREWGEVNGRGLNRLGTMLMELREELRASRQASVVYLRQRKRNSANRTDKAINRRKARISEK